MVCARRELELEFQRAKAGSELALPERVVAEQERGCGAAFDLIGLYVTTAVFSKEGNGLVAVILS